jgi:flagella synthesis protein FlgN
VNSPGSTEAFVADLRAERDQAAAFVVVLKAEQQALREGIAADVERLAPAKARMADCLAAYTARRLDCLAAMGYPRTAHGMNDWAEANAANTAAVGAWHMLQQHAGAARTLNDTNGKLIELRLRHCRQALGALERACGLTTLYGPQGHAVPVPTSRPLSAA